jgi:hypothetical protein
LDSSPLSRLVLASPAYSLAIQYMSAIGYACIHAGSISPT